VIAHELGHDGMAALLGLPYDSVPRLTVARSSPHTQQAGDEGIPAAHGRQPPRKKKARVNKSDDTSRYWVGEEFAGHLARAGAEQAQSIHEDRPAGPDSDRIGLQIQDDDGSDVFTRFESGRSTIYFSRRWFIYAYEALLGATLKDEWPLILAPTPAQQMARKQGETPEQVAGATRCLSGIELSAIAFRFVYLHEYFHARLGHSQYLSAKFGLDGFSAKPPKRMLDPDVQLTKRTRTAFELEADACAFNTLLRELFVGRFDERFATRAAGALAIGFVVELMYLLNIELTDSWELVGWDATFRFEDPGVYTSPIKRRFFLLAKLFDCCADETVARALERSVDYGASVARNCYPRVLPAKAAPAAAPPTQDEDSEFESRILRMTQSMRTGRGMQDPDEWVRYQDSILRRVRPELSAPQTPDPYQFRFVLDDDPASSASTSSTQ